MIFNLSPLFQLPSSLTLKLDSKAWTYTRRNPQILMELSPDPTIVQFKGNSLKHRVDFYQNGDSCFSIRYLLGVYYLSKTKANSPVSCLSEIYSQGSKADK